VPSYLGKDDNKDAAVVGRKPPAPEESPSAGGSDILATVIGGFFGLVFRFFWSLLVKTPINIVRMTFTLFMAYGTVSLVLLDVAEELASRWWGPIPITISIYREFINEKHASLLAKSVHVAYRSGRKESL
jgi:hypothetical protein